MAGRKQPIELVIAKGKKHLTKAEIDQRKSMEVKAPADKVKPPTYLDKKQKKEFKKIADELISLDIMSNLDVGALARYIISEDLYIKTTDQLNSINMADPNKLEELKEFSILQDRYFKQCRAAASDLGLTITSRCKLVVPTPKEEPKKNKFAKFSGG